MINFIKGHKYINDSGTVLEFVSYVLINDDTYNYQSAGYLFLNGSECVFIHSDSSELSSLTSK